MKFRVAVVGTIMAGAGAGAISTEECGTCKSPTKEISRSLCATCLNRNLQKACESAVVLSTVTPRFRRSGAPRALFPGMPRALLGPANLEKGRPASPPVCSRRALLSGVQRPVLGPLKSEKGQDVSPPSCRVTDDRNVAAPSSGISFPNLDPEGETVFLCDASKESESQQFGSADGTSGEARSQKVELADEEVTVGRGLEGGEQGSEPRLEEKGVDSSTEKWHLFQVQKNLTVRIPNSPMSMPLRPGRCQPLVVPTEQGNYSLPPRKDVRSRAAVRPSNIRKSSIKVNADAEAELMMRLLADSMPILKSTAPLVLPPCKVRPAPISPPSPSGDPLWKRRYIPCPKSLKVQVTSICVS